jgi:3-hydroxyisobutyrate dehydrogenase-like beta-hydroxyacid dehydrogenase
VGQLLSTSVIGTGPMGAALARTLSQRGAQVTVWNRTRATAEALSGFGIEVADTPAGALGASEMTIICVRNHGVSRELVRDVAQSGESLSGRLVVEMSSSTPTQARELYGEVVALGADALDANILCFPEHIGTPEGLFICAGPAGTWERAEPNLRALAECRYAGEDPGAARIVAKTAASIYFTAHSAFAEAYAAAIKLGADPETVLFAALAQNRLAADAMKMTAKEFTSGQLAEVEARMATRVSDAEVGYATIRSGGMPGVMIGAARDLMARAVEAGRGDEEMIALVEVLLAGAGGGERAES